MSTPRTRVATQLPTWLWSSDPREFGRTAGLRMIADSSRAGWWQLQTEESYRRVAPSLVGVEMLAADGQADRLDRLDQLVVPLGTDIRRGRPVEPELERIRRSRPGDFAAQAVVKNLAVTTAPEGQIVAAARAAWREWLSARDAGTGDRMFPEARVYAVQVSKALQFRTALTRILLRAESEPALYQQPPTNAGQPVEHFSSARGLLQGLYFLDPYLAPVLVGNAPYVWAFSAPRAGAQVIFSLGRFCNGTTGEPAEALQMFGPPSTTQTPPRLSVTADDLNAALSWWVRHLKRAASRDQ